MEKVFSAILHFLLKMPPALTIALAVVSGFLLLAPPGWLVSLGLGAIVIIHRGWISFVLIFCCSYLAAISLLYIGKAIIIIANTKLIDRRRIEHLHNLTSDEKSYLKPYVEGTTAQYFLITDGVAMGLVTKEILYRPSTVGTHYDGFAFNIQPWVLKYLKSHLVLLEGAGDKPNPPRDRYDF